jgi:hypothetical protein
VRGLEDVLDPRDIRRLEILEEVSKRVVENSGFTLLSELDNSPIEQAFHTTGTIQLSAESSLQGFRYPGISNEKSNLFVSGAAGFSNCSWVNPTFSILVVASLNAKSAL